MNNLEHLATGSQYALKARDMTHSRPLVYPGGAARASWPPAQACLSI